MLAGCRGPGTWQRLTMQVLSYRVLSVSTPDHFDHPCSLFAVSAILRPW